MKTPLLLDVPRTHPTRQNKLAAFKKQHNIQTHYCADFKSSGTQWMAIHIPTAVEQLKGYGAKDSMTLFDLIAKFSRLLDEMELMHEEHTELFAVRMAARRAKIPCDL